MSVWAAKKANSERESANGEEHGEWMRWRENCSYIYWWIKNHLCLALLFFLHVLVHFERKRIVKWSKEKELAWNRNDGWTEKNKWLNPDASCKLISTRIPQSELNANMELHGQQSEKKAANCEAPLNASMNERTMASGNFVWKQRREKGKKICLVNNERQSEKFFHLNWI